MKFISLIFFTLISVGAHAGGRPQWVISTPKADAQYKYYIGRAIEEMSEKEAWRTAKDQAQESAIRENFGVETSIASSSYESANQVALDKRVQELFPKVRLIDFEQIDSFVEKDDDRVSVWILFRYPIRQIAIETERLKSVGAVESVEFNEVGRPEINYSTTLEVTSEPLGIPVFINSERWGVTPLRVAGVLSTGVQKLKLSHENYQDVESDIVLSRGATRRTHYKLLPAVGYLRVSVNPSAAEIIVDGISRGKSSIGPVQVLVGRPARVEAKLSGYETQIQLVEVQKDEIRRVQFELNPIKRVPSSIEANSSTKQLFDRESEEFQNAWLFGILLGYSDASAPEQYGLPTAQLGFTVEKRFLWYFGLRGGLSYDFATEDTKTSETSEYSAIEGTGSFIGLPIYFTNSPRGIYLMPEIGQVKHKRIVESEDPYSYSTDEQFMEMNAKRKGVRLGYMNMDSHIDLWIAVHQYDWREYGTVQATSFGLTFTWNDGGQ